MPCIDSSRASSRAQPLGKLIPNFRLRALATLGQDQAEVRSLAERALHPEATVRCRCVHVGEIHCGSEPGLICRTAGPEPESGSQAPALVPVTLVDEGVGREIEGGAPAGA